MKSDIRVKIQNSAGVMIESYNRVDNLEEDSTINSILIPIERVIMCFKNTQDENSYLVFTNMRIIAESSSASVHYVKRNVIPLRYIQQWSSFEDKNILSLHIDASACDIDLDFHHDNKHMYLGVEEILARFTLRTF